MLQRWWYLCSWLLITTTLLKAARPRSLHDMKPTLGTNKAWFLQNRALVPISGLNACTYLPTSSKETLPLMNKLMELFSLFHMWIPPFTSIQNSSIRKQNVLAKSVERGRKFSTCHFCPTFSWDDGIKATWLVWKFFETSCCLQIQVFVTSLRHHFFNTDVHYYVKSIVSRGL